MSSSEITSFGRLALVPHLLLIGRMTRNYRPIIRVKPRGARSRSTAITMVGFSCFRLVRVFGRENLAFAPVAIAHSNSAMNAFLPR